MSKNVKTKGDKYDNNWQESAMYGLNSLDGAGETPENC